MTGATLDPGSGTSLSTGLSTGGTRAAVRLERHLPDPPPVVWRAIRQWSSSTESPRGTCQYQVSCQ